MCILAVECVNLILEWWFSLNTSLAMSFVTFIYDCKGNCISFIFTISLFYLLKIQSDQTINYFFRPSTWIGIFATQSSVAVFLLTALGATFITVLLHSITISLNYNSWINQTLTPVLLHPIFRKKRKMRLHFPCQIAKQHYITYAQYAK